MSNEFRFRRLQHMGCKTQSKKRRQREFLNTLIVALKMRLLLEIIVTRFDKLKFVNRGLGGCFEQKFGM